MHPMYTVESMNAKVEVWLLLIIVYCWWNNISSQINFRFSHRGRKRVQGLNSKLS
jgi:hypothetical protein